jgi:hypothetical protein
VGNLKILNSKMHGEMNPLVLPQISQVQPHHSMGAVMTAAEIVIATETEKGTETIETVTETEIEIVTVIVIEIAVVDLLGEVVEIIKLKISLAGMIDRIVEALLVQGDGVILLHEELDLLPDNLMLQSNTAVAEVILSFPQIEFTHRLCLFTLMHPLLETLMIEGIITHRQVLDQENGLKEEETCERDRLTKIHGIKDLTLENVIEIETETEIDIEKEIVTEIGNENVNETEKETENVNGNENVNGKGNGNEKEKETENVIAIENAIVCVIHRMDPHQIAGRIVVIVVDQIQETEELVYHLLIVDVKTLVVGLVLFLLVLLTGPFPHLDPPLQFQSMAAYPNLFQRNGANPV